MVSLGSKGILYLPPGLESFSGSQQCFPNDFLSVVMMYVLFLPVSENKCLPDPTGTVVSKTLTDICSEETS